VSFELGKMERAAANTYGEEPTEENCNSLKKKKKKKQKKKKKIKALLKGG